MKAQVINKSILIFNTAIKAEDVRRAKALAPSVLTLTLAGTDEPVFTVDVGKEPSIGKHGMVVSDNGAQPFLIDYDLKDKEKALKKYETLLIHVNAVEKQIMQNVNAIDELVSEINIEEIDMNVKTEVVEPEEEKVEA